VENPVDAPRLFGGQTYLRAFDMVSGPRPSRGPARGVDSGSGTAGPQSANHRNRI